MGTVGYIRDSIREVQDPLKDSISILLDCIEKLRPCGIVGEELGSLAGAVEMIESTYDSLDRKLQELRSFDSNQTSEDYLEDKENI